MKPEATTTISVSANSLRKGDVVMIEDDPHKVLSNALNCDGDLTVVNVETWNGGERQYEFRTHDMLPLVSREATT